MSDQTDTQIGLLTPFGLTSDEARIYLLLGEKGCFSALEISRELGITRTRVYRLLDKLTVAKLVIHKLDDRGLKFIATSPKQLEVLVAEKEAEVNQLKQELPAIAEKLAVLWSSGQEKSRVLYYSGIEGLEQVTWNSLRANKDLRIFEVEQNMSAFLTQKFSEKVRSELVQNKIKTFQLTNKKHIEPHTKVVDLPLKFWEVRYLDPKQLSLQFECLIYNDVVALYNFKGEEKFCVEIHNSSLAYQQKQLFDFVWKNSRKMKIIGNMGEARLI